MDLVLCRAYAIKCDNLTVELDEEGGYSGHAERCVMKCMHNLGVQYLRHELRKIGRKTGKEDSPEAGMRHGDERHCGVDLDGEGLADSGLCHGQGRLAGYWYGWCRT